MIPSFEAYTGPIAAWFRWFSQQATPIRKKKIHINIMYMYKQPACLSDSVVLWRRSESILRVRGHILKVNYCLYMPLAVTYKDTDKHENIQMSFIQYYVSTYVVNGELYLGTHLSLLIAIFIQIQKNRICLLNFKGLNVIYKELIFFVF